MEQQHEPFDAGRVEPNHDTPSTRCLATSNSASVSSPARCMAANRWSSPTMSLPMSPFPVYCGGGGGGVYGAGVYGAGVYGAGVYGGGAGEPDCPGNIGLAAPISERAV